MLTIRQIGLGVLAIAAIAVFFALKPAEAEASPSLPTFAPQAADYADLIESALEISELNSDNAETAPQQQVVNGWLANDLVEILAVENAQMVSQLDALSQQNVLAYEAATAPEQQDERPAALLVIVVLAVALWGATAAQTSPVTEGAPAKSQDGSNTSKQASPDEDSATPTA